MIKRPRQFSLQNHPISSQISLMLTIVVTLAAGCGGQRDWSSDEARAIEALKDIAQAQTAFQAGCYLDADYDGIGDYGTFNMLADPDGNRGVPPLMNPLYTTERAGIYELYIQLVPGEGEDSPPYWECYAFPPEKGLRCFYVDVSGVVRFADERETASRNSPPVDEPSADA